VLTCGATIDPDRSLWLLAGAQVVHRLSSVSHCTYGTRKLPVLHGVNASA
jgi:hypothetical protein